MTFKEWWNHMIEEEGDCWWGGAGWQTHIEAYRAGQAEMRERAAEFLDDYVLADGVEFGGESIRALPLEGDDD